MTASLSKRVVLGLDPAKHVSGWAISVGGKPKQWGIVNAWKSSSMSDMLTSVVIHTDYYYDDFVINCEASGHGTWSNFAVNRASGGLLGHIFCLAYYDDGTDLSEDEHVRYWYPQQWRKALYGTASKKDLGVTDWKKYDIEWAQKVVGKRHKITDDNIANAINLSMLKEQHDTKVQTVKTKRQRRVVKAAA